MTFSLSNFKYNLGTPSTGAYGITTQSVTGTTAQNGSINGTYAYQSGTSNQAVSVNVNNPNGKHQIGAINIEGVGYAAGATGSSTFGSSGSTGATGSTGCTGPSVGSGSSKWSGSTKYGIAGISGLGVAGAGSINATNNENGSTFNGVAAGITGVGGLLGGYGTANTANGAAKYGVLFIPGVGVALAAGNQSNGNYGYIAGNGSGVTYYANYNGQVYQA